jgi:hypothetical protein
VTYFYLGNRGGLALSTNRRVRRFPGCCRECTTVSRSSCESEIYATDEGTKLVLTIRHLLLDLGFADGTRPTPVWNDNRGCVDWTKGVTVSKKLRHINMRELGVRKSQQVGAVDIRHIGGKRNIADLFTKEIRMPRTSRKWQIQSQLLGVSWI